MCSTVCIAATRHDLCIIAGDFNARLDGVKRCRACLKFAARPSKACYCSTLLFTGEMLAHCQGHFSQRCKRPPLCMWASSESSESALEASTVRLISQSSKGILLYNWATGCTAKKSRVFSSGYSQHPAPHMCLRKDLPKDASWPEGTQEVHGAFRARERQLVV